MVEEDEYCFIESVSGVDKNPPLPSLKCDPY
jgi:hypothetical protein